MLIFLNANLFPVLFYDRENKPNWKESTEEFTFGFEDTPTAPKFSKKTRSSMNSITTRSRRQTGHDRRATGRGDCIHARCRTRANHLADTQSGAGQQKKVKINLIYVLLHTGNVIRINFSYGSRLGISAFFSLSENSGFRFRSLI